MSCNDKISDRCLNKVNAKCVNYEGILSDDSALTQNNCLNLEDVLEDMADQLNYLREITNVDGLSADSCISYPDQSPQGVVTPKTAIETLNARLKTVMTFVGLGCDGTSDDCPALFEQNIECLNLDFGALTDPCGQQPTTLKAVLQLILNQFQP